MLMHRTDGLTLDAETRLLPTPGRYGSSPRPRFAAIGVTLGVHAVLAAALLSLGVGATGQKAARIVAVNLTPGTETQQPEPEQAPQPSPAQPRQLDMAARAPDVPVPNVQPAIALAPAMVQPAAVTMVAPRAAEPAAPAPAPPAPPAPPAAVQVGDLGTRVLSAPPPRYPVQSRRRREQGTVELLLTLGPDGSVEAISVSRSSGFARLDDAALSAVRRWRWEPTLQAGAPVRVRGVVAIPFVLADRA